MTTPTPHGPAQGQESFAEQLARVQAMAEPSETWDLSFRDRLALRTVLAALTEAREALREIASMRLPQDRCVDNQMQTIARRTLSRLSQPALDRGGEGENTHG